MRIIYFLKILQKHILLIILVPLIIAAVTFFITRKGQWRYTSETIIYTGVMSGYTVQQETGTQSMMTTSATYDNLINLIKSRQTLEEVSVSLLAQHLLLDRYDARFISKEYWDDIIARVPPEVMDIVRKSKRGYKTSVQRTSYLDSYNDTVSDDYTQTSSSNRHRSASKNYHVVKPKETIYSISKANGISINELKKLNGLTQNVIEIGQRLILTQHEDIPTASPIPDEEYYPEPSPVNATGTPDSNNLSNYFSDTLSSFSPSRVLIDTNVFDRIVRQLLAYGHKNNYNFIYKLWNSPDDPVYSINALSKVGIYRVQNSDLIRLSYSSPDPGICQQSLIFLTRVFIRNYKILKQNQTDAVIQYFKRQLENANRRLQKSENDLLLFNERNNIINYYEQTKEIAISKEELDVAYQNKQIAFASSDAAIRIIEQKLEANAKLSLNTSAILRLRSELADATMQIANIEIDLGNDSATIKQLSRLKTRVDNIKSEIKSNIDQLYRITNSVEGLNLKDLLNSWLVNVIANVESKAALRVLGERKKHFQQVYSVFAPLGAEIKRIERLIGVTEQEFLTILHDLNLAKLRQQDDELSTNLKVVDAPYFPLYPIRSKAMLLVIMAGLVGLVLIIAILLLLEFFNTTIRTPDRAELFIKLKVAGIYPKIVKEIYSIDIGFILPRLVEILIQNIKIAAALINKEQQKKPQTILLFSTHDNEGKTTIGREICRKLKTYGENVLFLNYLEDLSNSSNELSSSDLIPVTDDEINYSITENFIEISEISELLQGYDYIDKDNFDFIIVELPSLINHAYPFNLISKFDHPLLVVRANRSWTDADSGMLKSFNTLLKYDAKIVLNGVELIYLDTVFGELPKHRSKFRIILKRILTFQIR